MTPGEDPSAQNDLGKEFSILMAQRNIRQRRNQQSAQHSTFSIATSRFQLSKAVLSHWMQRKGARVVAM
jgi:hypothetical protein